MISRSSCTPEARQSPKDRRKSECACLYHNIHHVCNRNNATISQNDGSVCGRYFFYLAGNLNYCPAAFVFIWDKIFDANFRLFVDMIGDIRQAFIDRPLLLLIQFRTACGQTGGFSYGIIVLRSLAVAPSCKLMAVWESLRHKSLSSIG